MVIGTFGQKLLEAGVVSANAVWGDLDLSKLDRSVTIQLKGSPAGFNKATFLRLKEEGVINVLLAANGYTVTGSIDPEGHIGRFRRYECYDQLRETIICGLFHALSTMAIIPWEILPPGRYPWEITGTDRGSGSRPRQLKTERLRFFDSLGPDFRFRGASTSEVWRLYFGFVFNGTNGNGRVFLENAWDQNAVYCFGLGTGLIDLMTKTKAELLNKRPVGFVGRVVHSGDWESQVQALLPS